MSEWYRPSKEPEKTSFGEKHFFRFDDWSFEVEWQTGENSDDLTTWIRPDQSGGYSTASPVWFPNKWPRFNEIIEPETAFWLLETVKESFEAGLYHGSKAKTAEIKNALGIK